MAVRGGLSDKIAIVTGASRGIGRAIAQKLARDGAACVLAARDAQALGAVAEEIRRLEGKAHVVPMDLREPDAPARLVESAVASFGGVDIVVNNAGATRRAEFLELTDDDWLDGFALKFLGAVRLTRAAWPHLKQRRGSVLNISGIGGRTPGAAFAVGGSVNAALLSLTKSLAATGIKDGIQVNAVSPGSIRTDRLKKRLSDIASARGVNLADAERAFVELEHVTRIGEPDDIANLVAFVVGPQGRFLHGALIDMDGGATKTI
jgi:NAD(P)-dependent dehydrogenase (short-subunit alcohol dehydrogenase family)